MIKSFLSISFCWFSILGTAAFAWAKLPYPPQSQCDQNLEKVYYHVCYSNEHRQARWTYHALLIKSINGKQKRTDNFRVDPDLIYPPVHPNDLRPTSFDRGHLVPAADMRLNYRAMSESFWMTNVAPQIANFNRGAWARLERLLRQTVLRYGNAYVVTGSLFSKRPYKTVKNISVAKYFYKVIFIPRQKKMLAFMLPHRKIAREEDLRKFMLSVDDLERYSGVDFFADLPDAFEEALESDRPISTFH